MNSWESFLLKFVQAAAPTVENLFIHNQKSIAVFNASDTLFSGVVDVMTTQQTAQQTGQVPQPSPLILVPVPSEMIPVEHKL